jgi:uncharacterized protein YecE (DUF72 family)
MKDRLRIGTAGWSIPADMRDRFPQGDSLLQRYSQKFNAVEINSSFHKPHKKITYERWAAATAADFLFAVKMPKEITHNNRLVDVEVPLDDFMNAISRLKTKLGPLLIQLPPSLKFEPKIADSFFTRIRNSFGGKVVIEPRHISWGDPEAAAILTAFHINRVIDDPVRVPIKTSSKQLFKYYRLHGSPQIYSSSYTDTYLDKLAKELTSSSWVIFDNSKFGAATYNALDLLMKKRDNSNA